MHLVVVESPAKAKTIESYLGSEYKVIASLGHIRDLPSSEGSVKPDNNFEMIWELGDKGKKQAKTLNEADKQHDETIKKHFRKYLTIKYSKVCFELQCLWEGREPFQLPED